mmetsp:Transcript_105611/g.298981  ORF Transcript_105611/g.298981 Transcript_105611/m.298981 type:complete len:252 (+) Transcript_105611:1072-1827(+)
MTPSFVSTKSTEWVFPACSLPTCSSLPVSPDRGGPPSEMVGTVPSPRTSNEREFVPGSLPSTTSALKLPTKLCRAVGRKRTLMYLYSCGGMCSSFVDRSKGKAWSLPGVPRGLISNLTSQGIALGLEMRNFADSRESLPELEPCVTTTGPKEKKRSSSQKARMSTRPDVAMASSRLRATNCSSKIDWTLSVSMPGVQLCPVRRYSLNPTSAPTAPKPPTVALKKDCRVCPAGSTFLVFCPDAGGRSGMPST